MFHLSISHPAASGMLCSWSEILEPLLSGGVTQKFILTAKRAENGIEFGR